MRIVPLRTVLPGRPSALAALVLLVGASLSCAAKIDPELAALPPDERIRTEIVRALRADTELDHEAIRVEVRDGEVVLSGVVSTYDESREALRIAGNVDGVVQVVNRLRVIPRRGTAASGPERGSGPP